MVVLMQVGAFYEIYGLKNPDASISPKTPILEFSSICNLNIAEKKIILSDSQVLMAGFRDYTLEKYLLKLTDSGYTAVVYVQEKDDRVKLGMKRVFHSVHSPGTYISYETDTSNQITNHIMCIWIERFRPISTKNTSPVSAIHDTLVFGIAAVNIFTGKTTLCEFQAPFFMNPTTFDELERCISTFKPSEIIFISQFDQETAKKMVHFSGIGSRTLLHYINILEPKTTIEQDKVAHCNNQVYINQILSSFYGADTFQLCSEFNTQITATQAFCYLLDFIQEHNRDLVKRIELPTFDLGTDRVILANHTLSQLNIIDDRSESGKNCGKMASVLSFLNRTCCPMGKREFQRQMLNPTVNEEWLNREYDTIGKFLTDFDEVDSIRLKLLGIKDIDKICRQIVVKKVYPASIFSLYQSIRGFMGIEPTISTKYQGLGNEGLFSIAQEIVVFLETCLNIDVCKDITSIQNFEENIIRLGISQELDILVQHYNQTMADFRDIRNFFNNFMITHESGEADYVKIHETEKSGMSLQMTKKRTNSLKKHLAKRPSDVLTINARISIAVSDIHFLSGTSQDEFNIPILRDIVSNMGRLKESINSAIESQYYLFLEKLESTHFNHLAQLSDYIGKIDVILAKVYVAKKYKYCRPQLDSSQQNAFVKTKELRHCLIEHIQQNEVYVPNDLVLGQEPLGILLYGTNAVGKTSLIRALGIAVIMAQTGMYVPATEFIYKPYRSVFSRILANDDLFRGLSTFAVEMSELRIILKMSDENSLILGDELCSGTETVSALSIFTAGLMELHRKRASFIFATHFHEITQYDEFRQLTGIRIAHMAVSYNKELDCLVYDRTVKDGQGSKMYGLEVCKSLHLPDDFLEIAYQIRNRHHPELRGEMSHPLTAYNSHKVRGVCEICHAQLGTEIHHIQHQADAGDDGYVGTVHKNHPANLMSVCETCHVTFHRNAKNASLRRKKTTKGYAYL